MRIPTFSRFCFCLDLQTGNKVLCWIFLIIYIAFVLLAVASLLFGTDFLEYRSEDVKEDVWNATFVQQELQEGKRMKFGVCKCFLWNCLKFKDSKSFERNFYAIFTADSLGTLVISLILIVVCFFFLNGINLVINFYLNIKNLVYFSREKIFSNFVEKNLVHISLKNLVHFKLKNLVHFRF